MKKSNGISQDKNFEDYMLRLQEIVSQLQAGDLPLNESLSIYKEGLECSRICREYLENARKEIEIWQTDEQNKTAE